MNIQTVLLLNANLQALQTLRSQLNESGYAVETAADTHEAKRVISSKTVDIVLCDNASLRVGGAEFLEWMNDREPSIVAVVVSTWADFGTNLEAAQRASLVKARIESAAQDVEDAEETDGEEEPDLDSVRLRMTEELERQHPGITQVRTDANGFLILNKRF